VNEDAPVSTEYPLVCAVLIEVTALPAFVLTPRNMTTTFPEVTDAGNVQLPLPGITDTPVLVVTQVLELDCTRVAQPDEASSRIASASLISHRRSAERMPSLPRL